MILSYNFSWCPQKCSFSLLLNHIGLAPVRLVPLLREDDSNDGLDELIANEESTYGISEEKTQSIIESSFEKGKRSCQNDYIAFLHITRKMPEKLGYRLH